MVNSQGYAQLRARRFPKGMGKAPRAALKVFNSDGKTQPRRARRFPKGDRKALWSPRRAKSLLECKGAL